MLPLPISADTAQKLAKKLNVPLEHLMHMPQHVLLKKLQEISAQDDQAESDEASGADEGNSNNSHR